MHHPIWNFDNCCASLLADVTINGKPRKVVAQPSKLGWLYVLDRATGEPIWPIEERPVPQSDVPGEKTSPTQPHPTKPPAYARNYMRVPDDVIDFTPELRQQALEIAIHGVGIVGGRQAGAPGFGESPPAQSIHRDSFGGRAATTWKTTVPCAVGSVSSVAGATTTRSPTAATLHRAVASGAFTV